MPDYQIRYDSDLVDAFLKRLTGTDRILVERVLLRFLNTHGAKGSSTAPKLLGVHTLLGTPVIRSGLFLRVWWVNRPPIAHILHLSLVEDDNSRDWFDEI
ncbi:MAG: hypothetical protein AAGA72_04575 [Pseudomonadota bacterium]